MSEPKINRLSISNIPAEIILDLAKFNPVDLNHVTVEEKLVLPSKEGKLYNNLFIFYIL